MREIHLHAIIKRRLRPLMRRVARTRAKNPRRVCGIGIQLWVQVRHSVPRAGSTFSGALCSLSRSERSSSKYRVETRVHRPETRAIYSKLRKLRLSRRREDMAVALMLSDPSHRSPFVQICLGDVRAFRRTSSMKWHVRLRGPW